MDLLLDNPSVHLVLERHSQLNPRLKTLVTDNENRCFLSVASLWEIAIKVGLGKLEIKEAFNHIAGFLNDNAVDVLPITLGHLQ